MIEFKMLGEIRLKAADGTELDAILRQSKRLAVLSYLAAPTPGTRHRRDLLLALFWPELDTAHARTSLRNAVYVLRQSLGDEVLRSAGDEEISVNPDLLRTDLAVVYSALREGRIDDALAAYGGELLPGLFPPDSEGFHRWLDSERTKLKVSVSSAALGKLNKLENRRDHQHALALARRVLDIQPDDETIVRRVMTLHEALGDTAGGLNVFEKYRARLAADFDAAPSAETSALAGRLRSSPRTSAGRSRISSVPVSAVVDQSDAPFVAAPVVNIQESRQRWAIPLIATTLLVLSALGAWVWRGPEPPMSIGTYAPLTTEEGLQVEAAISANGKLVAYAKGNVEHLRIYIQKIGGGPPKPLTNDSSANEIVPRWSPVDDEVLFLAHNNAYAASAADGIPRLVARGGIGTARVHSASWSPDGDSIAIVRNDSLLVQAVNDPHTRFVGTGYQLHSCVWSPVNGKWIACTSGNNIELEAGPLFGNKAHSQILLFPAAGGPAIPVTSSDKQNRAPAWSADGKYLWILSDRDGRPGQVYAIPIGKDGRVTGSVISVGIEAEWIGLSGDRIAYSQPNRRANIWAVPIPAHAPSDLKSSGEQITRETALIETLSVSPDGKWIVYDTDKPGNSDIYRMATSGGEPEPLTRDKRPEYAATISPDGTELAWHRWIGVKRHMVVRKIDSDSEVYVLPDSLDRGVPRWSPDGRAIAAWSHEGDEGSMFVVKRDASGRWGKVSWQLKDSQLPTWSPDGKMIAFVGYDGSIQTIPADSGARKILYAPRKDSDDPVVLNIAWSRSPDTAYFIAHNRTDYGSIWSIAMSTGAKKLLVRLNDPTKSVGLMLGTDQRRFYFTLDDRLSKIWWAELKKR